MGGWLRCSFAGMLLAATSLAGCGGAATISPPTGLTATAPQASYAAPKLNVAVSILPQKYLVERIGGQRVAVTVMVGPGAEPETYEPKPEQLVALSEAVAYFSIGLPFERVWMDRIVGANNTMTIIDTTEGIERLPMATDHQHRGEGSPSGQEGSSVDENLDPHIWLSPTLVKVQTQIVQEALAALDPGRAAEYQANLAGLFSDIDALDAEIRQTLAGVGTRKFIVFHPAWGYFARDYGLEMIPIELGGQEPSAQELAGLVTEAKAEGIRVIFASPAFSTRTAETIAKEIDGSVLLIDPLALDWLQNLRQVAETFAQVLSE